LNKNQIAKRYSKLLINTVNISDIPQTIEELKVFARVILLNRKFKILFESPIFSEEEKEEALKELLSYLKASQQTEKFLKILILRRHLFAINEVIAASIAAYNEKLKRMTAMVISSIALEQAYLDRLKNALKNITKRDIDIENQVDPSLLGGFVVKIGSTIYDNSLRGQLRLLRAELMR
jgi:ATP synthase F1 delta subunit